MALRFKSDREVFAAEGHVGHTGKLDLRLVVPNEILIQLEVKLTVADESDVEKNVGYAASAKRYGVPKCHCHRRLLATAGDKSIYPGRYHLLTWAHVAIQLRRTAALMVKKNKLLDASAVLGFTGAIEENLLGFSSSVAEEAFAGRPTPLSTGLIQHLEQSLNGGQQ